MISFSWPNYTFCALTKFHAHAISLLKGVFFEAVFDGTLKHVVGP